MRFLPVAGVGRVAYWKFESAAPVKSKVPMLVLAGGPGRGMEIWSTARMVRRYPQFDIYFLDQIGVGASDRLSREKITLDNSILAIDQFSRKIVGQKAIIVGGSWGAALAARYAVAHPEQVHALILQAPAGLPEVCEKAPTLSMMQCVVAMRPTVAATRKQEPIQRMSASNSQVEAIVTPPDPTFIPDGKFKTKRNRLQLAELIAVFSPSHSQQLVPLDERPQWEVKGLNIEVNKILRRLHRQTSIAVSPDATKIPTLILRGSLDWIPIETTGMYQLLFPSARFVELENETHTIDQDKCASMFETMIFLSQVTGIERPKACVNYLYSVSGFEDGYTLVAKLSY